MAIMDGKALILTSGVERAIVTPRENGYLDITYEVNEAGEWKPTFGKTSLAQTELTIKSK